MPRVSRNSEPTWRAFLWIAGMMMWVGFSWSSWMMYSPMSDSRASMPWPSRKWFISISSLTIDLPLITCRAWWAWAIARTMVLASSTVSAQCTFTPLRVRLASRRSSSSGSLDSARARTWLPISRRCSRSYSSGIEARRLAISESMAERMLPRSWLSPSAWRALRFRSRLLSSTTGMRWLMDGLRCAARGNWPGAGRAAGCPAVPASR